MFLWNVGSKLGKWWLGNDVWRMCSECEEDPGKSSEYFVLINLCLVAGKKIQEKELGL